MNQVMRAFNQDEGENCLICGIEIHEAEHTDMHGNPTGQTYLACDGECMIMAKGGR